METQTQQKALILIVKRVFSLLSLTLYSRRRFRAKSFFALFSIGIYVFFIIFEIRLKPVG